MTKLLLPLVLLALLVLCAEAGPRVAWSDVDSEHIARAKHWRQVEERVEGDHVVRFMIGLPVTNTKLLKETALAVSDPSSSRYGKYWTQAAVMEAFGPPPTARAELEAFLTSFPHVSLDWTSGDDFVVVEMQAAAVEEAFGISLCKFEHLRGGLDASPIVRSCLGSAPSVPAPVKPHMSIIEGLFNFPWIQQRRTSPSSRARTRVADSFSFSASAGDSTVLVNARLSGSSLSGVVAKLADPLVAGWVMEKESAAAGGSVSVTFTGVPNFVNFTLSVCAYSSDASECGASAPFVAYHSALVPRPWVTVESARRLYGIPRATTAAGLATQSVAEFSAQYYMPSDVETFFSLMGITPPSSSPSPDIRLVGPNNPNFAGGESTLDIEWVLAIAPQAPTYYWSVGDGGFLLEWIAQMSNASDPPLITSISYGEPEAFMLPSNQERFNEEAQKLAVRGVGIISTSGDLGSSDGLDVCAGDVPDFPSSSPWTTSLGATFVTRDRLSPLCAGGTRKPLFESGGIEVMCAANAEAPCQSDRGSVGFTTGGGFSRRFAREQWQEAAVKAYLQSAAANSAFFPPSGWFNSTARGFNDVAALGSNILIVRKGEIQATGGTSASGPIFAGLVTLLNDQRLQAGKPPLGFLNPFLYQAAEKYPQSFNLVLGGDNRCRETSSDGVEECCEYGFPAITPFNQTLLWNPLVGLGTPNYAGLLTAAMNL